jgi:integrase
MKGSEIMPKLTQKMVDTTKAPATGQVFYRDEELEGFALRVTPGSKSYIVECRVNGKARRITLGKASLLTIDEARLQARQTLVQMASGFDPHAEKRNEKVASVTLLEVLEEYLAVRTLKPSTVEVYRRVVKKSLKEWLSLPITEITKNMVEDRHRQLASGTKHGHPGRAYSNFCFKTLQTLLNYAAEKYEINGEPIISVNPVSRLTKTRAWHRVHPRTGVIPEYQLAAWYKAVDEIENKTVRDYLLLLLFTGVRRREGSSLKWTDIDFKSQTLTIRRTQAKNHRDHVLPICDFLFSILKARYENRGGSPYIFPGRANRSHVTDFRFWQLQVREKTGCKFMIHDLRRTFLSCAERLELPYYVLKRLANHTASSDTLVPYIVVSMERLRLHIERISAHFLELMQVAPVSICAGSK